MTTLLAHDPTWSHGGWFFFPLFWILGFFLIIGLLRGLFWRRHRHHRYNYHSGSARSVLAERYARGEIDEQEYRQRLAVLNTPHETPKR
ncbi:MAG TPA: hypothetical protein DGT23_17330 [Micromonosporaceae bacterium]|nr:hypothetical protein [Micromonosporaceae bacterium]